MYLLEVEDLHISVNVKGRLHEVVQGVSFHLDESETFGIVGESGCGKSLTALAIIGLLDKSSTRITGGHIRFNGVDLLTMSPRQRRATMGSGIAMIFQEPMTSLNPVYRIGDQIREMLKTHTGASRQECRLRIQSLLEMVRIPEPEKRMDYYPHQLSGGQRQRVMIAMALACEPRLLIADEPTTALDVTVQKEVLELMLDLQKRLGTSIILVSHDLGVISETCNKVAVMYRGKIVEMADVDSLFTHMSHPYTQGLLNSIPSVDKEVDWLDAIPGRVPAIDEPLAGCAFHPRCTKVLDTCSSTTPSQYYLPGDKHWYRCHLGEGANK